MRLVSALFVIVVVSALFFSSATANDSTLSAADTNRLFQSFLKNFKRVYPANLLASRLAAFRANLNRITAFDSLKRQRGGAIKHTIGVNEFSDLTPEEFRSTYLRYKPENSPRGASFLESNASFGTSEEGTLSELSSSDAALADSFSTGWDWSLRFIFPLVRHQGRCGSCYAFVTAATIEAARSIAHLPNITVAVQPFVDCASSPCTGCLGGTAACAYDFAKSRGYFREEQYPYTRGNEKFGMVSSVKQSAISLFCSRMHKDTPAGKISGYRSVPANNLNAYVTAIKRTPLFSVLDAAGIQLYKSGIVTAGSMNCTTQANHAMVAVGYGTDPSGTRFISFRNSWGMGWGESGYVRMAAGNTCGILSQAHYPVLG